VKPTRGARRRNEQGVEEVFGCCSSNRNGEGWCIVDEAFPESRKSCSRHLEQIKDARNRKKRMKSTTWFNDDGLHEIGLPFLPGDTVTFEGSVVIKKGPYGGRRDGYVASRHRRVG
jgi:hypothetical protein